MRSGNLMDGTYFFLIFVPFMLSIWAGELMRKKVVYPFVSDHFRNQNLSSFLGVSVQILTMITGIFAGFLLTKYF